MLRLYVDLLSAIASWTFLRMSPMLLSDNVESHCDVHTNKTTNRRVVIWQIKADVTDGCAHFRGKNTTNIRKYVNIKTKRCYSPVPFSILTATVYHFVTVVYIFFIKLQRLNTVSVWQTGFSALQQWTSKSLMSHSTHYCSVQGQSL